MTFTTRPEITGTFGAVASTHWIASAVGMRMLELGGTAADAAAAMGFVQTVVEPHLNGPLGDMPLLVWPAQDDNPTVICGQGVAPSGATIEHMRGQGLEMIPGSGLLATVVPGAFGACPPGIQVAALVGHSVAKNSASPPMIAAARGSRG